MSLFSGTLLRKLNLPVLVGFQLLKRMNVESHDPRVVNQLLELQHRMIGELAQDAKHYAQHRAGPMAEIEKLKQEIAGGRNPRDIKVMLAQEIVERFHTRQAAEDALADFDHRARGGIPVEIPEVALSGAPIGIGQLLKQANLCTSSSEALRMVEQGGVRIDGVTISDKGLKVDAGSFVLQVGKRKFARVTLS